MALPKTRRARYLLYRKRAIQKLRRLAWRNERHNTDPAKDKNRTTRRRDASDYGKQVERVYPRHFPELAMSPAAWLIAGWTPPRYKRWGFLGPDDGVPWVSPPGDHNRYALIPTYHARRVISLPRLKHLPLIPHVGGPPAGLTLKNVYPLPYYHSGAESYALRTGLIERPEV